MRNLPSAVAAHLAAGGGMAVQMLVWLVARDRATGAPEPFGFWTGADHQMITVAGEGRTYYGAGALLEVDPVTSSTAQLSRSWQFKVSQLDPTVAEAIRTYDARLAPVEVHEWHWDPEANLPLAEPLRVMRGTVMDLAVPTPPAGQQAEAIVRIVTDAWRLTRGLPLMRSHEALQARTAGADSFRRYGNLTGVSVAWGEHSAAAGDLFSAAAAPAWTGGQR